MDTSVETEAYEASEPAGIPVETGPWTLTSFTPATNEIYCSFFNIGDDGRRGERVFITEIAGVPAPAHVGLDGEAVALTQVVERRKTGRRRSGSTRIPNAASSWRCR